MLNIFATYDNRGFKVAKLESDPMPFHVSDYFDVVELVIKSCVHDWSKGFCESFQIFNEQGEIIFNFPTEAK